MKPGGVMVAGAKYKAIANFDPEVFRNKDMGDLMLALRHAGFDQVSIIQIILLAHHTNCRRVASCQAGRTHSRRPRCPEFLGHGLHDHRPARRMPAQAHARSVAP